MARDEPTLPPHPASALHGDPGPVGLWQVPLFLVACVILLATWLSRPLWTQGEARLVQRLIQGAREQLDDPTAPVAELIEKLQQTLESPGLGNRQLGAVHFLLGTAFLRRAQSLDPANSQEAWLRARQHLEAAAALGVPPGDEVPLVYRLGCADAHTDADPQEVIRLLTTSPGETVAERVEGYTVLTQAYLRSTPPLTSAALEVNQKLLQLPVENEAVLAPARLLRAELLMQQKDYEGARRVLSHVAGSVPAALKARARRLQAECWQATEAWAEAGAAWEEVLADRAERPADAGRVLFYLGQCHFHQGHAAEAALAWERALRFDGEEALAARIRLGELRGMSGQFENALHRFEEALAKVPRPEAYQNQLVSLDEARRQTEIQARAASQHGQHGVARRLGLLHARLDPGIGGFLLLAELAEAWAEAEDKHPSAGSESEPAATAAAQTHSRDAGLAYEQAADKAETAAARADILWKAGRCFLRGQDFEHGIRVLERFVQQPPSAERLSEAWYRLGQAHQALKHETAASAAFRRCIEIPGPFGYRARYELAVIKRDRGHRAEAEDILKQNLDLMRVDTERVAHERSLFALAELLYLRGAYHLAAERWEQALTLYPTNANAALARFRMGECYRLLADVELVGLQPEEKFTVSLRAHYRQQYSVLLQRAAANYQKLTDDLEARSATTPLTPAETAIYRQAMLARADCRFNLGQFDEAVRLYDQIATRCRRDVDGLLALRELWRCYAVQIQKDRNNVDLARATLERIRITLNSLDDSAFQDRPEAQRRAAWEKWLTDSEDLLKKQGF